MNLLNSFDIPIHVYIFLNFRLSSASAINIIIPYFFYSKGDQKDSHKRVPITGKSFSEALILASTNPQYDKSLFIELQIQHTKIASSEHGENMAWVEHAQNIWCT